MKQQQRQYNPITKWLQCQSNAGGAAPQLSVSLVKIKIRKKKRTKEKEEKNKIKYK